MVIELKYKGMYLIKMNGARLESGEPRKSRVAPIDLPLKNAHLTGHRAYHGPFLYQDRANCGVLRVRDAGTSQLTGTGNASQIPLIGARTLRWHQKLANFAAFPVHFGC